MRHLLDSLLTLPGWVALRARGRAKAARARATRP